MLPPEVARRLLGGDEPDARLAGRRPAGWPGSPQPGSGVEGGAGPLQHRPRRPVGSSENWIPAAGGGLRPRFLDGGPLHATAFVDFSDEEPTGDEVTFRGSEAIGRTFDDWSTSPTRPTSSRRSCPRHDRGADRPSTPAAPSGTTARGRAGARHPVRDREADPMREQIRGTPGAVDLANGAAVAVGPLGVLLSGSSDDGGWLVRHRHPGRARPGRRGPARRHRHPRRHRVRRPRLSAPTG